MSLFKSSHRLITDPLSSNSITVKEMPQTTRHLHTYRNSSPTFTQILYFQSTNYPQSASIVLLLTMGWDSAAPSSTSKRLNQRCRIGQGSLPGPSWPPSCPAPGVLTTLGDVHLLQRDDGCVHVHAVELLVLQVRLTLLLPELDPADVTAAVKKVPL